MQSSPGRPEAPTATNSPRLLLLHIIGFGVPVGIGISPWFGNHQSAVWQAFLEPFPVSLRIVLVPLSLVLMGAIAVATQFYSRSYWSRCRLEKLFGRVFLLFIFSTLLLTTVYFLVVVRVPIDGGGSSVSLTVGMSRDSSCPRSNDPSDVAYVEYLDLEAVDLHRCWSDPKIKLAEISLALVFLTVTSLLAFLVGILLMDNRRALRRR